MPRLTDLIPDEAILLALQPSELAPYVLQAAKSVQQNGLVMLDCVVGGIFKGDSLAMNNPNTYQDRPQVVLAVAEAWSWLESNQLLVPDLGMNGSNGWKKFSRAAAAMKTAADFNNFQSVARFPKHLMHPLIADPVWSELVRGNYADAVFKAFRLVEEQVREAGKFSASDYGVELMRAAFHPETGPLTKKSDVASERHALSALFAGAIGSYKNPHSHRTVTIEDPAEAQEIVLFASHLLRIVDSRRGT